MRTIVFFLVYLRIYLGPYTILLASYPSISGIVVRNIFGKFLPLDNLLVDNYIVRFRRGILPYLDLSFSNLRFYRIGKDP